MRRDDSGRDAGLSWRPGGLNEGLLSEVSALHPDALTGGGADELAGLLARAAHAPVGVIHLVQGDTLRLYGGHGLTDFWSRTEQPLAGTLAAAVIESGAPLVIDDLTGRGLTGAYLGHPMRDQNGVVLAVCGAADVEPRPWTDEDAASVAQAARVGTLLITEQLARYEIDRQHRFLDAALDSLHDGVTACDEQGRIVFVNERMRRIWEETGLTKVADLGLTRALLGDNLRDSEVMLQGDNRRARHYLVDAHPIAGPGGQTLGAVQAVQDVTRRKRVERFRTCELAVTTALADAPSIEAAGPRVLEAVVNTLEWVHAELWLVDETASVVRSAARWSAPGWQSDIEVPVDLPFGVGLAGRAWQVAKPLWIRDVGRPQSLISPETAASGELHAALAVPVREGFEMLGVLTVFADTIEEPEDELLALMAGIAAHIGQFVEKRLVEDLQRQLTRSKNEYLALVGHELRTPLTSISAYTELLREADEVSLVTDGPRLLEVIERNTNQLRDIINELMELSALDTGHADVHLAPMDLAEVVRDSLAKARAAVIDAPLVIEDELPEQLVLPGDRKRLRQVVDNLLGNAVKYSPDGGHIGVTLRAAGRAAELAVSDTGLGVSIEEREKLFTGLYRTSRARDSAIPGSGLGMTLSRAVVSRHHGSIELVDHEGPGTTVLVRLPMEAR